MTFIRHAAATAVMAVALLAISTSSAQAITWTGLDTTTAEEISAVEYSPTGKIWFATTAGKIFSRPAGGTFAQNASFPGRQFTDIAFRPAGDIGLATADSGVLYRTVNGGNTWTGVNLAASSFNHTCPFSPSPPYGTAAPTADLLAVEWASDTVAWVVSADRGQVLRTTNGGANWADASRDDQGECKINAELTDVAPIPGSVNDVYFVGSYFGTIWRTSDGLLSDAAERSGLVNCVEPTHLAVDPASPNRISAAGECGGSLHWGFSSDSGTTSDWVDSISGADIQDVDAAAGVFLAVGNAGLIEQTFDGEKVYSQPDSGAFATRNWRSVDFADASHAAVAGVGGALAITDQANVPPPTPAGPTPPAPTPDVLRPTVGRPTIGSGTLIPGQGTTFGFNASEAGLAVLTFEKRFDGLKSKRKGKNVCLPKTKKRLSALRKQAGSKSAYRTLLRKKACQGYQRIGAIRQQARSGRNTIAFNGRVAGRKLAKGNYRAKLTITDAAGNVSRAETIRFKVVGKKKR